MKATRQADPVRAASPGELAVLRARLAEADEMLRAIREGEVDSLVIAGKRGAQVFTLQGAEHAYRVLIESMNEGALTVTPDKMILYANRSFARMVKCPLEQVMGCSFRRFLSAEDRVTLRRRLKLAGKSGAKIQVQLTAADGSRIPVQISIRRMKKNGFARAPIGMVVTDMTEARRIEVVLRALTQRVVQVQEAERGRVALELHDNIGQLLCAALFRSQALAASLSARAGPAKRDALKLRTMLGRAAGEVERISRDLRPGVLDQLGLIAVLRATGSDFAQRTGVAVKLTCVHMSARLPAAMELALYRIFQDALKNVEQHAAARQVTVFLKRRGADVQLVITDDGVGFDPDRPVKRRTGKGGLGLVSMRERATYVGGALAVTSGRRAGTVISVRMTVPPAGKAR